MSDAQKLALAAIGTALVTAVVISALPEKDASRGTTETAKFSLDVSKFARDRSKKDVEPTKDRVSDVRAFRDVDGGVVFGILDDVDGGARLVDAPPQFVIPDCDETEKPVDCLCRGRWSGCNNCPKALATGTQCKPSGAWHFFGEALVK